MFVDCLCYRTCVSWDEQDHILRF